MAGVSAAKTDRSGGFAVEWSKLALKAKDLRRDFLLTGGFTLGSIGVGDNFGRGWGFIAACAAALAYEYHLSHRE